MARPKERPAGCSTEARPKRMTQSPWETLEFLEARAGEHGGPVTNLQRAMRLRVQARPVVSGEAHHAEEAPDLKAGWFKGRPET